MAALFDALAGRTVATGDLQIVYPDGTSRRYGDRTGAPCTIRIHDRRTLRRLITSPVLGFGEAWTEGAITVEQGSLERLMELLIDAGTRRTGLGRIASLRQFVRRAFGPIVQHNPARRARRNASHHYDIDRRIYDLFLDRDLQYSCAYFETGHETLDQAQHNKRAHIARKLLLDRPDLTVLDIGCGWGGMALHLAREHGARVRGITLSAEQLETARARAEAEGLADRVRFDLVDYRSLHEPYDRIVSVGMFEHVGIGHYPAFFAAVARCLRPDGAALVHSIGRADGPGATNEWIGRHIFPGGYAPALSETLAAVERSGLWVTDCEILRLHYARTIALWRERFEAAHDTVVRLAGERFRRMFELYLVGSELAFRRLGHMNFQLQLARTRDAVPLVRDYLARSLPSRTDPTGITTR